MHTRDGIWMKNVKNEARSFISFDFGMRKCGVCKKERVVLNFLQPEQTDFARNRGEVDLYISD